jgi:hypothetical protein
MLLRKAGVLKVVVADLNAARGVVTLAAAELAKSARERRMEADIYAAAAGVDKAGCIYRYAMNGGCQFA